MIYESKFNKSASGFASPTYVPVFGYKLWAAYRFLKGDWVLINAAMHTTEVCTFTINWNDKIKVGMKVFYNDELYNITRIDDFEGYKKDIKLHCERVLNWKKDDFMIL